jgi:hypothetical protein
MTAKARLEIQPPKTWDDFAARPRPYHSKNSKSYLVNVSPLSRVRSRLLVAGTVSRPFTFAGPADCQGRSCLTRKHRNKPKFGVTW